MFKECLTEEAIVVCGKTQRMRRHKNESWWWNEEIAALVKEKQRLFECWKGPKICRKRADVRRQTGANSVDTGGMQEAWTI